MRRTENYKRMKAIMEENKAKALAKAAAKKLARKKRAEAKTAATEDIKIEDTLEVFSQMMQEQNILNKHPSFYEYAKIERPYWFADEGQTFLKREYREDFLNEVEFFNIEKKNYGFGKHHTYEYLFKKNCLHYKEHDNTFFCTKCYKRHPNKQETQDPKSFEVRKTKNVSKKVVEEDPLTSTNFKVIKARMEELTAAYNEKMKQNKQAEQMRKMGKQPESSNSVGIVKYDIPSTASVIQKSRYRGESVAGEDKGNELTDGKGCKGYVNDKPSSSDAFCTECTVFIPSEKPKSTAGESDDDLDKLLGNLDLTDEPT